MRNTFLIVLTLIFTVGLNFGQKQEKLFSTKNIPAEKNEINGIRVGVNTQNDVIKKIGNDYELITHDVYSKQLIYSKLGLSFFYCQKDEKQIIFSIELRKPFQFTTSKGIVLGESQVKDVIKLYGETEQKNYSWLEY